MYDQELAFLRDAARAALLPRHATAVQAWGSTPLDWTTVVMLAGRHRSAGFAADALRALPEGAAPTSSRRQLEAAALAIVARNLASFAELTGALAVLEQ